MPRYHALDTGIKLCVWDPQTAPQMKTKKNTKNDPHTASTNDTFSRPNGSLLTPNKLNAAEKSGPASGYVVDDLKEGYFEGHEGVDFLGPAAPFYLVKAGRELFVLEEDNRGGLSQSTKGAMITRTSTPFFDAPTSSPQLSDPDKSFSNLEGEFLRPCEGPFTVSKQASQADISKQDTSLNGVAFSTKLSKVRNRSQNEAVVKPITSPKPLAVTVDLSRKSFMPSVITKQRQELCITIYYNGELTHSRIVRANTYSSTTGPVYDEKCQFYSGRRVDTFVEIPWVVLPHSKTTGQAKPLGFRERWNEVNQILRVEADEWGRYGRFRSPMGEYLEELSKRKVPESAGILPGDGAGIIDVIITHGRTVGGAVSGLRVPRRKLPEDRCGLSGQLIVVPEELRPEKKARIVADFNRETAERDLSAKARNAVAIEETKGGGKRPVYRTARREVSDNEPAVPRVPTEQTPDGPSEPFPLFHIRYQQVIDPSRNVQESPLDLARRVSLTPSSSSSPVVRNMASSQTFHLPMPTIRDYPHKISNVAQKYYKGAEPNADSGPPPKRRRLDMELSNLTIDLKEPVSATTRSRRAVSSPPVQIPEEDSVQQPEASTNGRGSSPLKTSVSFDSSAVHQSNSESSSFAREIDNSADSTKAILDMIRNNAGEILSLKAPKVDGDATFLKNQPQIFANKAKALETSNDAQRESPSPADNLHGRRQRKHFGFDGTSDEPKWPARQRSSAATARSRASLHKNENEPIFDTATSSGNPPHSDRHQAIEGNKVTRIVFKMKNNKTISAVVDRQKFENLQRSNFAAKNRDATDNTEKSTWTWTQTNKFVTANYPSVRRRKEAAEAAAATAATESVTNSFPSQVVPSSQAPSSNKIATKKKRIAALADRPSSIITTTGAMGGKTTTLPVGGKTVFYPQTANTTETGAVVGKTVLPPILLKKKIKSSQAGIPTRGADYALWDASASIATPSKTQLKPSKASSTTLKGGNAKLKPPENRDGHPPTQNTRKRESVSSRELKELLEPHKSATGLDTSFGASSKEETKKTRARRPSKPNTLFQDSGLSAGIANRSGHEQMPLVAAAKATVPMARQKSGSTSKEPLFPNLLIAKQDTYEAQSDKSTSNVLKDAMQFEGYPSMSSADSNVDDLMATTSARRASESIAKVIESSASTVDRESDVFEAPKEQHDQDTPQNTTLTSKRKDLSSEPIPVGRPSRSYSVDAEGKKIPSPRNDSLLSSNRLPQPQPVTASATPKPLKSAVSSSVPAKRSSLSHGMPKSPTVSTATGKKLPEVLTMSAAPRRKQPVTSQPQKSESAARAPVPPRTPKISVSETLTLSRSAPTPSTPLRTPTSQAKSRKIKAADLCNGWKPTPLCDGSVLSYASGEPWPGVSIDPKSRDIFRTIKSEREGVFRASGVLMGVRFVIGLL